MVTKVGSLEGIKNTIVEWLLERSPKSHWEAMGMGHLLYAPAWHVEDYSQNDYGLEGDQNIRIYAIKDASVDGVLSGRIRIVTDYSDEVILSIDAYSTKAELSHHQKHFFRLCGARGLEEVKSDHPEFGSW